MSSLRHLPLGQPIPDRPHAVSVSLPTMADVIGYEEKKPEVMRQVPTGYPRFVVHPFVKTLTAEFARRKNLGGLSVWLASSPHLGERMLRWLAIPEARLVVEGRLAAVAFPPHPDHDARAKSFLQHSGGFLTSRQAQDALAEAGLIPRPRAEELHRGNAVGAVKSALGRVFTGTTADDQFLAANGMNAIHSVFCAVNEIQAPRGRDVWIQLGWLYLDTIAILAKFTGRPADHHVVIGDVHDLGAVRRVLEENRGRVAAIVTEAPTNPLLQTCDAAALSALAREHGAHLLLDASIASPWNVDLLPHADVALASLTKYAANVGDLVAGCAVVNPRGADAAALRAGIGRWIEPPYARDLARLAHEIGDVDEIVRRINENTPRVAEFLAAHPAVARVHWALAPESRANYLKVARHAGAVGCMISFELRPGVPLAAFYDRVRVGKGPSFGITTTLLCPFMYLAHYDLVTTPEGRAKLGAHGINPELLRLAVGTEPIDELLAAFGEALDAVHRAG